MPRPDVSEKRRTEIVDAAARVFSRKGFNGASMDDIVQETGVSKGLLYWYFKGKDAIIITLMERLLGPEIRRVQALADTAGPARDRLLGFADSTVRDIQRMHRMMPITFEFYSLAFRNQAIRQTFQKFFRTFIEGIEKVVQQGVAGGEFRTVDARSIALALMAGFEGNILLWVFDRRLADLGQLRLSAELILNGIGSDMSPDATKHSLVRETRS